MRAGRLPPACSFWYAHLCRDRVHSLNSPERQGASRSVKTKHCLQHSTVSRQLQTRAIASKVCRNVLQRCAWREQARQAQDAEGRDE